MPKCGRPNTAATLPEEVLCGVCLSIFVDPCALPCGHTWCEQCINTWLENCDGFEVPHRRRGKCPVCKQDLHASELREFSNTLTESKAKEMQLPVEMQLEALDEADYGTKALCVMKQMLKVIRNDPSAKFVLVQGLAFFFCQV